MYFVLKHGDIPAGYVRFTRGYLPFIVILEAWIKSNSYHGKDVSPMIWVSIFWGIPRIGWGGSNPAYHLQECI